VPKFQATSGRLKHYCGFSEHPQSGPIFLVWAQYYSFNIVATMAMNFANYERRGSVPYSQQEDARTFGNYMSPQRRTSLLSVSFFDMPLTPVGHRAPIAPGGEMHNQNEGEADPFAPISLHDAASYASPVRSTQTYSNNMPHPQFIGSRDPQAYLTDRSESSVPSMCASSYSSNGAMFGGLGNYQVFKPILTAPISPDRSPTAVTSFPQSPPRAPPQVSLRKPPLDSESVAEGDDEDDDDQQRFKKFHEEKWSVRYNELLLFLREHGHAAVPHTYPANPQLARWVKRQRRQYKLRKDGKASTMTVERLELLSSVGFIWDSHDVNWREKLISLTEYRVKYGNCNVPSNYQDKKLATWVKCQRRQYKLYNAKRPSAMSLERINELEKIGFEWEIRASNSRSSQCSS